RERPRPPFPPSLVGTISSSIATRQRHRRRKTGDGSRRPCAGGVEVAPPRRDPHGRRLGAALGAGRGGGARLPPGRVRATRRLSRRPRPLGLPLHRLLPAAVLLPRHP